MHHPADGSRPAPIAPARTPDIVATAFIIVLVVAVIVVALVEKRRK
jgi:hypothetical protein